MTDKQADTVAAIRAMINQLRFFWWRLRVSSYGWYYFGIKWEGLRFNWWGFVDREQEYESFTDGYTAREQFFEAWCSE